MSGILVQTREASPLLHEVRPQGAPRVVPTISDAAPQEDKLSQMPVALANAAREPSRRISAGAPLSLGSLLYLGSVGLIAAGIVAAFFGAGFSLLVPTGGATISGSANKVGPEAVSLLPALGNDQQQTFSGQASAADNKDAAQSSTASPAPSQAPAAVGKDDVPQSDRVSASRGPADTSVVPANAPVSGPNSPAATALAPPISGLSKAELTELLHHGDTLLRTGDISSARLFYERAADAGDGRAALRLGATFDPEFLGRLGLGKLQADPAEARSWYSRARDLGEIDAKRRLNSLETRQGE
jgi:hypothetical protein